ncbi:MAG: GNAT family N-acetyltransferase [Cytophagaceae bacterium]|nr:GNAT family N-acetyltransferase [Gemmatimonadaceae bacterium]
MRTVATTPRLVLREFSHEDAPFILELVNDADWQRFIGDRAVHSVGDAQGYLDNGPITSYGANGFGLYLVARRDDDSRLGMCGLVRRDTLEHPDLGYAFLPAFRGMGYATEAAAAMLTHAWTGLSLPRVLAITNPENAGSIRVLERLGFALERQISVRDGAPEVNLYGVSRPV